MIGDRSLRALALLLSFVPQVAMAAPDHTTLEEFQYAPDGDDYAPAFERMQQSLAARPTTLLKAAGPRVLLSCGKEYHLSRTAHWCLPMEVEGCGMEAGGFATNGAFTPFIQHAENKCPFGMAFSDKATGKYVLRDLSILDKTFADQTMRAGLDITWTVTLDNVKVRGFIVGVMVHGDATPEGTEEISNANLAEFNNVWVSDAQGPGLLMGEMGGDNTSDTNVIRVNGGSFSGNCTAGSHWAPSLRPVKYCTSHPADAACTDPSMGCAGVFDISFLGGSYLSPHTASNKDLTTLQKFSGYVIAGDSNRTVLIDPYSESFSCTGSCETPGGGNYMGPQVQVIGGHSNWVGPGTWIHGNQVNTMVSVNEKDPANVVQMSLGAPNSPGAFMEWRAYADSASSAWRSQYTLSGRWANWYTELFKNATSLTGILHSGEKTKLAGVTLPLASIALPPRTYWDTGTALVREGRGPASALPVLDGTWPDGSTWRRTGTSSATGVTLYEAQTIATKRKWVPISRRP